MALLYVASVAVTAAAVSPRYEYLIARKPSISLSAMAAAVVTLLARLIWIEPEWNIENTARIPIESTVIAARSSIMPKPAFLRARPQIRFLRAYILRRHRQLCDSTQAEKG